MDVRLRLEALSFEIDQSKAEYMGFVEQTMENPQLMERVTRGLTTEERHLVELELMILEQVADLEPGAPGGGNRETKMECEHVNFVFLLLFPFSVADEGPVDAAAVVIVVAATTVPDAAATVPDAAATVSYSASDVAIKLYLFRVVPREASGGLPP